MVVDWNSKQRSILGNVIHGKIESSNQHMKKLMSLRQGLHVMMQCFLRLHLTDRYCLHEHQDGHSSWRGTYDKEIHKMVNFLLRKMACM